MGERNKTRFLKDVKHRNPVFSGRFHADFFTAITCKPVCQLAKPLGKGRKAFPFVNGSSFFIGDADTGINPSFVNVQATAVFAKDFEHGVPPKNCIWRIGSDWSSGKIESILKR